MVRAHIKWPTAAARKARAAGRPPAPSRQRALKKTAPQPMVRAHIKWPTAAAESTRGASSPAHAAIHADAAAAFRPFTPTGAELSARTARPIARPAPSRQRALKKYAPPRTVRAHIKWPTAATRKARAARPPPRTPPYMPMLPRTPAPSRQRALKKTAPQPMVRAHIKRPARRRPQSTRGASSPARAAIHADAAAALRPLRASGR